MTSPRKIVILGTIGNCLDILETIQAINAAEGAARYECAGFLDDNEAAWGQVLHGVRVLGPLAAAGDLDDVCFVNGIGSPSSFWKKEALLTRTRIPVERFETLVHPAAFVSQWSQLGRGTVVFPHVTITSHAQVGDQVIILPSSVLSHDVRVGDYTCIAAGVCVSGNVTVGRSCYLGTRSALNNGVTLGEECLVGMGSVVLEDVAANSVVVGNPAWFLRRTRPE